LPTSPPPASPPRSTLFPYTTLFRSRRGRIGEREPERLRQKRVAGEDALRVAEARPGAGATAPLGVVVERRQVVVDERERMDELRSEEHTSELQSPYELVCRLLLDKKKTSPIADSGLLTPWTRSYTAFATRHMPRRLPIRVPINKLNPPRTLTTASNIPQRHSAPPT